MWKYIISFHFSKLWRCIPPHFNFKTWPSEYQEFQYHPIQLFSRYFCNYSNEMFLRRIYDKILFSVFERFDFWMHIEFLWSHLINESWISGRGLAVLHLFWTCIYDWHIDSKQLWLYNQYIRSKVFANFLVHCLL